MKVTEKMIHTSQNFPDRDDLISDGMLGLVKGMRAWDDQRTHLVLRERYGERENWLVTSVYRAMVDGLRKRGGRSKKGGHPKLEFRTSMLRLDQRVRSSGSRPGDYGDKLIDVVGWEDPYLDEVESQDLLAGLPPHEAEAIWRTVIEGETLAEVGKRWHVSEGRVCQIRQHGLDRLRGGRSMPEPVLDRNGLSNREIEVLQLAADGLSNEQIAKRLVIARETVKGHMKHATQKLHAANRTDCVVKAMRRGLIH